MLRLCLQKYGNDSEIYIKRVMAETGAPYQTAVDTRQLLGQRLNVLKNDDHLYINL